MKKILVGTVGAIALNLMASGGASRVLLTLLPPESPNECNDRTNSEGADR